MKFQAVSGIVDLNSEKTERNSETESQAGMSGSDENSRDFLSMEGVNGDKLGKISKSRNLGKKGSKKTKLK